MHMNAYKCDGPPADAADDPAADAAEATGAWVMHSRCEAWGRGAIDWVGIYIGRKKRKN